MDIIRTGIPALAAACVALAPAAAAACTNFLISKGATADGSTVVTYSADSHTLYGDLPVLPAGVHGDGETVDIHEWDTGKYLGKIKQAPRTYAVVGHMNEHQVTVTETTFTGRNELKDPNGVIDYGSLMFLALQRSRTAREAIETMGALVAEYGYASTGESFSIADPKEVWIMDLIGKGKGAKGAVWVALRVPDGYVSAHANRARISTFPQNDPKNCLYAKDVISFARDKGWFKGTDAEFSFTAVYHPLSFGAMRFCEARVWAMFRRIAPSLKLPADFARGVEGAEPLPLWIKPDRPLTVKDVMELMRDHYEGTEFDLSKGVGAGPYNLPYRWRPMEWEYEGQKYLHERATSTQQTGYSVVAQARSWLPDPIGGVLWFGVDDTFSTVYVPMYCGIREAPRPFAVGTGNFKEFSWDSAFWVFNWVSNWAYTRYSDMIPIIRGVQAELEGEFLAMQPEIDRAAQALYAQSPEQARDYLTRYSAGQGVKTHARWRKLGEQLFVKFLDGNVRDAMGEVKHPAYSKEWYKRIVGESGESLKVKKIKGEQDEE